MRIDIMLKQMMSGKILAISGKNGIDRYKLKDNELYNQYQDRGFKRINTNSSHISILKYFASRKHYYKHVKFTFESSEESKGEIK